MFYILVIYRRYGVYRIFFNTGLLYNSHLGYMQYSIACYNEQCIVDYSRNIKYYHTNSWVSFWIYMFYFYKVFDARNDVMLLAVQSNTQRIC